MVDGIVPLKPTKNVPKPIELLKKETTAEFAEAQFYPILPLPSPSKVRPKLRPTPRLAPHRRNSIQVMCYCIFFLCKFYKHNAT